MKILKIKLDQSDQELIFQKLTEMFDTSRYDIFRRGQTINFDFENFEVEAVLVLYQEGHIDPETNAPIIIYRSVLKFRITFFYLGEEVEVSDWNIDERIDNYYSK